MEKKNNKINISHSYLNNVSIFSPTSYRLCLIGEIKRYLFRFWKSELWTWRQKLIKDIDRVNRQGEQMSLKKKNLGSFIQPIGVVYFYFFLMGESSHFHRCFLLLRLIWNFRRLRRVIWRWTDGGEKRINWKTTKNRFVVFVSIREYQPFVSANGIFWLDLTRASFPTKKHMGECTSRLNWGSRTNIDEMIQITMTKEWRMMTFSSDICLTVTLWSLLLFGKKWG